MSLGSLLRVGSGGNPHWVSLGSWRRPGYTSNRKHTMTDYDINELTKAGFLELACPPASPYAKALVADIINIIEQTKENNNNCLE